MTIEGLMVVFRFELAQGAMQACWHAVYSNDAEPTPASIRFIDQVISVARDESLPIGRRHRAA